MDGTGLVLAGGGGKGIYQVGILRSLAEAGYLDDVVAVSGSSIGGVNACLFADGVAEDSVIHSIEQMEKAWEEIDYGVFFNIDTASLQVGDSHFSRKATEKLIDKYLDYSLFGETSSEQKTIESIMSSGVGSVATNEFMEVPTGIHDFREVVETPAMDYSEIASDALSTQSVDYNAASLDNVTSKAMPVFVTCAKCPPGVVSSEQITEAELTLITSGSTDYTYQNYTAEYMKLNNKSSSYIKSAILATTALPVIYSPVRVEGSLYVDGGVKDNVPIRPLYDMGIRRFIVIELTQTSGIRDAQLYKDAEIIDILPSRDLGSLLSGTMNFDREDIRFKKMLGELDGKRYIKTLFEKDESYIAVQAALAEMDFQQAKRNIEFERKYSSLSGSAKRNFDYINKLEESLKKYDL